MATSENTLAFDLLKEKVQCLLKTITGRILLIWLQRCQKKVAVNYQTIYLEVIQIRK